MDVINNRVWIENTSPRVTDISKLDFDTYETISILKDAGAKLEIGPANPPIYGVGIYCTNFSLEKIKKILKEARPLAREMSNPSIEELDTKEEIYKRLKDLSLRYNMAKYNGSFGLNDQKILEEVKETFTKEIMPLISQMSKEDQIAFLKKLTSENDLEEESLIKKASSYLENILDLDEDHLATSHLDGDIVLDLANRIINVLRNYHLVTKDNTIGPNDHIILNSLTNEFNNIIVPAVISLDSEDKLRLIEKIKMMAISSNVEEGLVQKMVMAIESQLGRSK